MRFFSHHTVSFGVWHSTTVSLFSCVKINSSTTASWVCISKKKFRVGGVGGGGGGVEFCEGSKVKREIEGRRGKFAGQIMV